MLPGVSLESNPSTAAQQRSAHATAPTSASAICIRIFAPGSDVCEAHFSLIPFPESLIDAVVNTPAAARRSGLSYAIPHRSPPWFHVHVPSVDRKASLAHTFFTCLHPLPTFIFLLLCCALPSSSTEQFLSVLHSFVANPQDSHPLPEVSSLHHTHRPGFGLIRPNLT